MTVRVEFSQQATPNGEKKQYIFALTPLGKSKVREFEGEGMEFMVMAKLAERGPSPLVDIAEAAGISQDKARIVLKSLTRKQFVHTTGAGGE